MRATDVLLQEHRLIQIAVLGLEEVVHDVESGTCSQIEQAADVLHFLREFAEGLHCQKEEAHFFPRLVQHGFGPRAGLVSVMLEEHRNGSACLERVVDALASVNGPASRERFATIARQYIHGVRTHMRTEKTIVFWVATKLFTDEDEEVVLDGFDRMDGASRSLLSRLRLRPLAIA